MTQNALIQPKFQPTDEIFERTLRPKLLNDFTGQDDLCANLDVFLKAAKARKESLDHILFFGPPGLGKTTLAQIVANELGVGFRSTAGPMLTKAGDLAAILTNLQPHDVLFIDEIHRLPAAVEEILYPAMEDFKLDLIIGEGPAARSIQIDLSPFTLVGATTRTGLLTAPLRDRFGIPLRLNFYTPQALVYIIDRAASLQGLTLTSESLHEIAMRSRGTPRIAGRLVRRIRDFAEVEHLKVAKIDIVKHALNRLGVDTLGLDEQDRKYLEAIAHSYNGGPVGVETLAAVLCEQKDSVEEVIEPYLIQQGLIQRTPRGRQLTDAAYAYLDLRRSEN